MDKSAVGDEANEGLVDKLRSDDFKQLVDGSVQLMEKQFEQQLCLSASGDVYRGNPLDVEGKLPSVKEKQHNDENEKPFDQDELRELRKLRIDDMKKEKEMRDHWKSVGHGQYREIDNERDFFKKVDKHERAVCVLCEDTADLGDRLHDTLRKTAEKHIETAFVRLRESKAHFMLQMLKLEGLPTLLILRHGKVTTAFSPLQIRKCASLKRFLWQQDVLGVGDASHSEHSSDDTSSAKSSSDEEVEMNRRRRFMR